MIASIRGPVAALSVDHAVVEVGGVGMLVHCAPATLAALRLGQEATLATSLVVREDSLTLYGFADADERVTFETLQTASGVGPRLAQALLAVHAPDDIRRAIADEDLAALCLVPGIGRKGAQRLVLELKDRLGPPHATGPARRPSAPATWQVQLKDALTGLGYDPREADEAVAAVAPEPGDGQIEIPALLRQALAVLRRG